MRATLLAVLFAAATVAGACGDDDPTPPDPAVVAATVGTYALTTLNDTPLPYKYFQTDSSRFDFISGQIVLEEDFDMSDELRSTETRLSDGGPIGEEAVQRYLGTWSIRSDSVRLSYPGLGIVMAGRTSTTLTIVDDQDNIFVYSK
jgi:hypothetical protein